MKTTCSPLTVKKNQQSKLTGNCGFHNLHLDAIQSQLRKPDVWGFDLPFGGLKPLERWDQVETTKRNFTNKQSLTNQILTRVFCWGSGFGSFGPVFSKRSLTRNLSQQNLHEEKKSPIWSWTLEALQGEFTKADLGKLSLLGWHHLFNGCFWFP